MHDSSSSSLENYSPEHEALSQNAEDDEDMGDNKVSENNSDQEGDKPLTSAVQEDAAEKAAKGALKRPVKKQASKTLKREQKVFARPTAAASSDENEEENYQNY